MVEFSALCLFLERRPIFFLLAMTPGAVLNCGRQNIGSPGMSASLEPQSLSVLHGQKGFADVIKGLEMEESPV